MPKGKRKKWPRGPVSKKQWRKLFVLAKQGRLKGGTRKAREIARRGRPHPTKYRRLPTYKRGRRRR